MFKVGDTVQVILKNSESYGKHLQVLNLKEDNFYELSDGLSHFGDYLKLSAKKEAVNSPSHYNTGRVEIIQVIEDVTKGYDDAYVGYLIGNAIKYISRAPHKHVTPLEDLRKAEYHIKKAIERLSN